MAVGVSVGDKLVAVFRYDDTFDGDHCAWQLVDNLYRNGIDAKVVYDVDWRYGTGEDVSNLTELSKALDETETKKRESK